MNADDLLLLIILIMGMTYLNWPIIRRDLFSLRKPSKSKGAISSNTSSVEMEEQLPERL